MQGLKILSAEDFAERPRVGFDEEFNSLGDAMVILSWMDASDHAKIYDTYLQVMSESPTVTSHEYVMRVLAQKFNITAQRAAAVVELAHREEQLRKAGKKIYYGAQAYADAKIREHISKAYSEYEETDPGEFVEDPVGVTGIPSAEYATGTFVSIRDELDVDAITKATLIREEAGGRLKIDGHIYREDTDENLQFVKLTKDAVKLMETKRGFSGDNDVSFRREELKPMPGNDKPRRPRWKFAAITVNTRLEKKNKSLSRRKKHEIEKNVIVEHDGEVRPASVAEIMASCWKPVRNFQEKTYSSVKAAWLEQKLSGAKGVWGRQSAPVPTTEEISQVVLDDDSVFGKPLKDYEEVSEEIADDTFDEEEVDLEEPEDDEDTKK